jgi:hypothetical protein
MHPDTVQRPSDTVYRSFTKNAAICASTERFSSWHSRCLVGGVRDQLAKPGESIDECN